MQSKNKLKHNIKVTIGILLLIAGVAGLLYFNCWIAFIHPIIEICKALNANTITTAMIANALINYVFYNFIGSLVFIIGYYFGMFLVFNPTDLL